MKRPRRRENDRQYSHQQTVLSSMTNVDKREETDIKDNVYIRFVADKSKHFNV